MAAAHSVQFVAQVVAIVGLSEPRPVAGHSDWTLGCFSMEAAAAVTADVAVDAATVVADVVATAVADAAAVAAAAVVAAAAAVVAAATVVAAAEDVVGMAGDVASMASFLMLGSWILGLVVPQSFVAESFDQGHPTLVDYHCPVGWVH